MKPAMKQIRRILCAVIAVAMLLGTASVSLAEAAADSAQAAPFTTYSHGDRVTLIDGNCADGPVTSFDDAARVVDGVLDQLGGAADTTLAPWRVLTDGYGNQIYVFQQMYDNTTVLGGAVKVITNAEGEMLGLTASIEANPDATGTAEGIDGPKAEQIVLDRAMETRQQALTVVEGLTERMILPLILGLDIEEEAVGGSRYVWVVYTDNPDSSLSRSSDLPYLAHYVTLTGEYLYSLPTIMPGDEAGARGFDTSYVFEFMEPVDYTGYVDLANGEEKELTVTVMRDKRTGMYYLGNLERRIVVADCWEFLYNGNRVVLNASPDNLQWDQTGLMTLYNYCRAYDYYKAIGWIGGDGLGTPMLVLNGYCDINHTPIDNAAYAGGFLGWQIFLASQGNVFSQCLDVLAHEFTHCVTGTVMTHNAYSNDYGAINEAMSDIQGKTCQMLTDGRENASWVLGDAGTPVRNMAEPHSFAQPDFTWDLYYKPHVRTPSTFNDQGGVHTNSSLLNHLAYLLYEDGGMTLEEGRAFWFTVDCAMVPGTDYAQLAELLPLGLRAAGLEKYDEALRRALDATRLGVEALPETFDADRALLTLHLPEDGIFADEQWVLTVHTVDVDKLVEKATKIIGNIMNNDYSDLPPFVQDLLKEAEKPAEKPKKEKKGLFATLRDALLNKDKAEPVETPAPVEAETPEELDAMKTELLTWVQEHLEDVFYSSNTNAGQDGNTMRMMGVPGYALPVLQHGRVNETEGLFEDFGYLIRIGDRWIDVFALMEAINSEQSETRDAFMDENIKPIVDRIIDNIENVHSLNDVLDLLFFHVQGGVENELPADGLDTLQPMLQSLPIEAGQASDAEPKMSRPKLEETSEAA